MTDRIPEDRLPADWLPDPGAPPRGGDPELWERRLQRLVHAAEPALAELARTATTPGHRRAQAAEGWWTLLTTQWKPMLSTAALAAALVLGLRLLPAADAPALASPSAFTLTTVVGGGEPAALWSGAGVQSDPVLAQLVLEGGAR